jgi:predicted nucleotidyltransferase component of viral defense system
MIDLSQLLVFYPHELHQFRRNILREYLQYRILASIASAPNGNTLRFMGGTCIHFVYNSRRFSEDLDFDNPGITAGDFEDIVASVTADLVRQGYSVESRTTSENSMQAYLRFPNILQESGITGHREEKLDIHLDTEPQNYAYEAGAFLLNKFDIFCRIKVAPPSLLLAQKLLCIFYRKRAMGRDFFDAALLLGLTRPDLGYLSKKIGIASSTDLKTRLLDRCDKLDFKALAKDLSPFVFDPRDCVRVELFPDLIRQWDPDK